VNSPLLNFTKQIMKLILSPERNGQYGDCPKRLEKQTSWSDRWSPRWRQRSEKNCGLKFRINFQWITCKIYKGMSMEYKYFEKYCIFPFFVGGNLPVRELWRKIFFSRDSDITISIVCLYECKDIKSHPISCTVCAKPFEQKLGLYRTLQTLYGPGFWGVQIEAYF